MWDRVPGKNCDVTANSADLGQIISLKYYQLIITGGMIKCSYVGVSNLWLVVIDGAR